MAQTKAQEALHPLFSSPKRLMIGGLFVLMAVWLIQTSSGIPAYRSFAPIELSSNVVATMGLAWTIIQLRAYRATPRLRRAWASCAVGMALLAIEGSLGETFLDVAHGPAEMGLSIAVWLLAAYLIFRGGRVFAPRRSVVAILWIGFAIQLAAQTVGWISVAWPDYSQSTEWLEYLNDMGELSAVLAYICALLLAEFGPLKNYQFPAASIGRKARAVIRDFGLLQAGRRPTQTPLRGALTRGIARGAMLFWRVLSLAPSVQMSGGPNVLRQVVDLVRLGAKGVSPQSYYALGLFHVSRRAAVDEFMTNAETNGGLAAGIRRQASCPLPVDELNDRLLFGRLCEAAELPAAPVYATVARGVVTSSRDHAAFDRDLVVQDRRGGARTARRFRRIEPFVYRGPFGETLGFDDILMRLASAPGDMLIQPGLRNHESVAFLSDESQVVFRAVTCLDDATGAPRVTHGLARVRSSAAADWARSREQVWGAAIDLETGALGALYGDAPSVERCDDHPVTGVAVRGVRLKHWPEICALAARAHAAFGGWAIICWDIVLTPRGAVILHGDLRIDFDFLQRCYGTPLGRSPLGPTMDRRLDALLAEQLERFTLDGRRTTY
ncbi:sugar-transfer associated ATP-grasp domain-containing protein [Hansschlegelia zhihuaiae]|uniref:Alpha-L-glutamate ligase-related protein ATP-grasp domain-containing protein n=1 Tax=Hansschlegelia zhihuaiae TaxID=405005 RepID=A0A4Q0MJI0_9HYPH|nr:sugar-transfer associated ATP-grasp domain-containing protein [Hansschlegelia zhihuaiae]RXF73730.1 hypothetical protein EK403_09090 [Hansschlegelia zhihuaiae]